MIEILTLFRGHARFIYWPEPSEGDILTLFQAKFKQVFQDLLRMVRCKLLFQIYDDKYDEYVDMGKDTVFGRTNKVRVQEIPQASVRESGILFSTFSRSPVVLAMIIFNV